MLKNVEASLGVPSPMGLSFQGEACNFALFSAHAQEVWIGLFAPDSQELASPTVAFPLKKTGDIWHIALKNVPSGTLYAYQCRGDWNEKTGDLFNQNQWLLDPYAKFPASSPVWNKAPLKRILSAIQKPIPFDWKNTARPHLSKQDLIIYEMHVRGFTIHGSSRVEKRGTYAGMIEKIPYLKELGVNAVQLMPIYEFDECHSKNIDPETKEHLPNYWGYNPISFFGVKQSYGTFSEFKTLVRELHKNGIEVFLDVVYNHTGEGKERDYAISWRGIDNRTYYLIGSAGNYRDYTGCGNTIAANHPVVQALILDSLRYFAEEMHIDGFRFDLASILTRGLDGKPMENPPILAAIAKDPLLSSLRLISEAWDAAGLYQVGSFAKWGPWMEWNGKYRDICRSFIKGTDGKAGCFASVLSGSDFLYGATKTPTSGINFITAHDGYSLRDLVTYQDKYNRENGDMNRDGSDQNFNWNCGIEGETTLPNILALRERQMRNHLLALFLSQGIPMLLMGDEYGHTRLGNNNPYVQDNEINWFLWDELEKNQEIFQFVKDLIAFRKNHPQLRKTRFLSDSDVQWLGIKGQQADWSGSSRFVSLLTKATPKLFIAFNANFQSAEIKLPEDTSWHLVINTKDGWRMQKNGPNVSSIVQMDPYSAFLCMEKTE
jgi:isoamylase/glycogen operon protein